MKKKMKLEQLVCILPKLIKHNHLCIFCCNLAGSQKATLLRPDFYLFTCPVKMAISMKAFREIDYYLIAPKHLISSGSDVNLVICLYLFK